MSLFVLYSKKSRPSAKALAKELRKNSVGLAVARGLPTSKLLRSRKFDYVLNVGNSTMCNFDSNTVVINHPKQISVSANKRIARMRFKARKIPAPSLWLSAEEIPAAEFPVIGRTTYHMKAQGFWYCKNSREALLAARQGATHFMKFIKNTREFRAHVFACNLYPSSKEDYVIGKLSEKKGGVNISGTTIKNHDNGYMFMSPSQSNPAVLDSVRNIAKDVVHKFGLHYGGVDLMYSKDTGRVYVLEINTTPCLTDDNSTTIDVYTDKILSLIGAQRE